MKTMSVAPSPSLKPLSLATRASGASRLAALPLLFVLITVPNYNNAAVHALNVAVTGATGRVGRLVVDRCLQSGHDVTAVVRNVDKANELFSAGVKPTGGNGVTVRRLDFADLAAPPGPAAETAGARTLVGNPYLASLAGAPPASGTSVSDALEGADRVIWCCSGFVDTPDGAKECLDIVGMAHLLPALSRLSSPGGAAPDPAPPSLVMLSSAGVTRPGWDDAKKAGLVGCADIPIVNLNPGGILGKKVVAEDMLRGGDVPYCVVRPTGLKFDDQEWPRGRSVLSQGDVAVGRMNANDLANLLVDLLNEPSATGKTFECVTLAGYPPPTSLTPVLSQLKPDGATTTDDDVYTAYRLMQQLLPGENQDATRLEMGRTYEQLDSGAVPARERGAAPTERELELAGTVVDGGGGGMSLRRRIGRLFGRS